MCDGSDAIAVEYLFCTVPLEEFWTSPFDNIVGDIVQAKVVAVNERGDSLPSDANTDGARVQVVPDQMHQPTRGSDTSSL